MENVLGTFHHCYSSPQRLEGIFLKISPWEPGRFPRSKAQKIEGSHKTVATKSFFPIGSPTQFSEIYQNYHLTIPSL